LAKDRLADGQTRRPPYLAFLGPVVDAEYGSVTFLSTLEQAELELRVSTSGLLFRPIALRESGRHGPQPPGRDPGPVAFVRLSRAWPTGGSSMSQSSTAISLGLLAKALLLSALLLLTCSAAELFAEEPYERALHTWKTPEDIAAWIAANFSYDMTRAVRLSEAQRTRPSTTSAPFSILRPAQLFETKTGVCVDLSRFGVETLRRIDPRSDPKYLMVEFEPIHIGGSTLRLHWLASFKRDGKTYFFADSKRPGHIAGPYDAVREFIADYEQDRGRRILAFRERESYRKQRRALRVGAVKAALAPSATAE